MTTNAEKESGTPDKLCGHCWLFTGSPVCQGGMFCDIPGKVSTALPAGVDLMMITPDCFGEQPDVFYYVNFDITKSDQ